MKYFIGGGHAANMANTLCFIVQQGLLHNYEAMGRSFAGSVQNFADSKLLRKNSAAALTLWNLGFAALRGLQADREPAPVLIAEVKVAMTLLSKRLGIDLDADFKMLTGEDFDASSR